MQNGVMFQSFEWEMEAGGDFYNDLAKLAPELKARGFNSVWLPPVYKATSTYDVGYGVYDLFDLGEFDQKGSVRTKYGTKEQLLACTEALHEAGIRVYMDVVLNHKAGADFSEVFSAVPVDPEDRTQTIGEARDIEGWTGFNFPGRRGKYSSFEWHSQHFTGVDYDHLSGETGVFRIEGKNKGWAYGVSNEKGNFDYLMFADIDHSQDDVREELEKWADWFIETTGCDGFRLDAVKHIDDHFMTHFTEHVREKAGPGFYIFGEYWHPDLHHTGKYLYNVRYNMDIFDVGLHFHLAEAAANDYYNLRGLFDNTVVKEFPQNAVTFVDNHDSQPGQALESWVGRHFKERAYALILLRRDGYPCVFAGDYYGIKGGPSPQEDVQYDLNRVLELRRNFAYGEQKDYLQDEQCIGWSRSGDEEHPGLLAVVISMREESSIEMNFGPEQAGRHFRDYLDRFTDLLQLDEEGRASFPVKAGSVSCWVTYLGEEFQNGETRLKGHVARGEQEKLAGEAPREAEA